MNRFRIVITTALVAIVGLGATASAAEAPFVGKQRTYAGTYSPLTVPGTGLKKGGRIPKGAKLVLRTVKLEGKQTIRTTLTAPKGKTIQGAAPDGDVGFTVTSKKYPGGRSVALRGYVPSTSDDGRLTGRIYALVK